MGISATATAPINVTAIAVTPGIPKYLVKVCPAPELYSNSNLLDQI